MATITKGKTFVNGELVTPEKIHQLVDSATIANITNADIAAGAAIADTKLAQISTAGKVLPAAVQGTAVITSDSRLSDARTPTTHTHDDRYYTETEMNNLLAGKQASGSYAPATGIAPSAITGTAVITTDSRLSDARTPTDGSVTTAKIADSAITSAKIADGTIVNADINASAAIALSKLAAGALPTAVTVASANIVDGTIVNADISDSAAIADTKLATISSAGKVSNAATTATAAATVNTIVARDGDGAVNISDLYSNSLTVGSIYSNASSDSMSVYTLSAAIESGSNYGMLQFNRGAAASSPYISFYQGGTIRGSITPSGASGIAYTTSSDYRLKTNIEPLTAAVARLLQIPAHRFNWLADPTAPKVDGFLAHEAQAVVPESVTGTKDAVDADGTPAYQGIDQSKLVPLLVAAVQELAARVAALEAK